jgi:hypothetical protein
MIGGRLLREAIVAVSTMPPASSGEDNSGAASGDGDAPPK